MFNIIYSYVVTQKLACVAAVLTKDIPIGEGLTRSIFFIS